MYESRRSWLEAATEAFDLTLGIRYYPGAYRGSDRSRIDMSF